LAERGTPERYPEDFLAEAREIVQGLADDVLALDTKATSGAPDPALLQRIFRAAHSLKGLAGMFGAVAVATLAHALEDLLDALRLGRERVTREVLDVLFEVPGVLESLLSDEPAEEAAAEISGRLRAMAGPGGPVAMPPPPYELPRDVLEVLTDYEVFRLHEAARQKRHVMGVRCQFAIEHLEEGLAALRNQLQAVGEVVTAAPTAGEEPGSIAFIVLVASELPAAELTRLLGAPVEDCARTASPATAAAAAPPARSARVSGGSVRVEIARLDSLMNIVGDLGLTRAAMGRLAERLQAEPGQAAFGLELAREVRTLERRLRMLRQGLLESRLVPLTPLFARMTRVVRSLAREAGKEIAFLTSGGETEIDKLMVEQLSDPLVHLLRNAIDHGIEPVAERARRGKPPEGRATLEARSDGNRVTISVRDDGAGVDLERVRAVAEGRGLVAPGAARDLGERETLSLLFLPGLSTRPEATEISGRGVGLDVVKTNLVRLSGLVEVQTRAGEGTVFTLTVPVTLAILPALVVRDGGETLALPVGAVVETAAIDARERGDGWLRLRGASFACVEVASRLGFRDHPPQTGFFAVVVAVGKRAVALCVDEVVGQEEVVVKPLGRLLGRVEHVAGVAELGGGELGLVLDLASLVAEVPVP
jgi:two-component system chemotaxis sensor kinase CheA